MRRFRSIQFLWASHLNGPAPGATAVSASPRFGVHTERTRDTTMQGILRGLVRAAACIRAHGYPGYPDPQVQDGIPVLPPLPASIDTNSPQFQAAQQTCHDAAAG